MNNAAERAFLKTVELGSIRAAARILGQDASSVSRRITQLERRLGARLVDRSGKATTLTEKGRIYFERLQEIIGQLDALEAEVGGEAAHPSGLLRVSASIDFGQEFLTDWLMAFRGLHPKVEFDLELASGFVDLGRNNIDVAIRAGRLPDSALVARKLADAPRVLVASPEYLSRRGVPKTAEDLSAHDFVFFTNANRRQKLVLRDPKGRNVQVERKSGIAINAVRSIVEAVLAGQGIHNGPLWAFADLIEKRALAVVLADHSQDPFPLWAVRQETVVVPARVTQFIEFLGERVAEVNGLIPVKRHR